MKSNPDKDMNGGQIEGSRPVPDPTTLTTDQLRREIASLRELLEGRLRGMDTATELVKATTDKIPCLIDQKVRQLEKVVDERFSSIDKQFQERDTRGERESKDNKVAVDAALQAAKEAFSEQNKANAQANTKMETSFTKQIDATGAQIQTVTKAMDDKFEDVKGRLATLESSINTRSIVTTEAKTQQSWVVPMLVLGAITVVGIIIQLVSIFKP